MSTFVTMARGGPTWHQRASASHPATRPDVLLTELTQIADVIG